MTNKQKILDEIERLKIEKRKENLPFHALYYDGYDAACDKIIACLNSLPAEQTNDELDVEINLEYKSNYKLKELTLEEFRTIVYHFAEWQKEQMIKSAFDGEITKFFDCNLSVKAQLPKDSKCCFGDKVKVIIIKEDK